jgi:predicted lactoylglutathione lyase
MGGALQVESPAAVKAVYDNAIELVGQDAGAPGSRGEGFNAGDFGDLDGNKLNPFYIGSRLSPMSAAALDPDRAGPI